MTMRLGLSLGLELSGFRCFVCREPITLRPLTKLPVDVLEAFKDLQAGKKPKVCCACGGDHDFKRKHAAFRRYLQFLAMHVPEEGMAEDLEGMA